MRRKGRPAAILSAVIALALGLSLYLSDVRFGNWAVTVIPEKYSPSIETYAEGGYAGALLTLEGLVRDQSGLPIAGAMVTASINDAVYRYTTYSNAEGRYAMAISISDSIELRARAPGFGDQVDQIGQNSGSVSRDFNLARLSPPEERSDVLTASAHAALLEWPDEAMRSTFVSQCHFCHQIGNELTRAPRETETWTKVVERMEGYLVMVTNAERRTIRDALAATFTGDPISAQQTHDYSPDLDTAAIEEWAVGDGQSFIHDADVGQDGRIYGVDEGHDVLWILDRQTGKIERVPFPASDLPVGGNFSGLALPIGIFTGKHGPHSLAQAADGRFWITNALSSTLMSYQPATGEFEVFPIGGDALYPHTIRIDNKGIVWFTLAASNQVARFAPETGTFTIINLPSNGLASWITDLYFPLILKTAALFPRSNLHLVLSHHKWFGIGKDAMALPYGIDVHPSDGSIWYAKLHANRIGRIDPETLEVVEFETPLKGPRRPRFDSNGVLWIPSFEDSALMAFDARQNAFRTYKLPLLAPNEYETPYALNVNRETGMIWITSNQSDRVLRFDPTDETFVSYPMPTRVSFLRDLVFTEEGKICSTQSNLPAYAIEGGVPSLICIDPNRTR